MATTQRGLRHPEFVGVCVHGFQTLDLRPRQHRRVVHDLLNKTPPVASKESTKTVPRRVGPQVATPTLLLQRCRDRTELDAQANSFSLEQYVTAACPEMSKSKLQCSLHGGIPLPQQVHDQVKILIILEVLCVIKASTCWNVCVLQAVKESISRLLKYSEDVGMIELLEHSKLFADLSYERLLSSCINRTDAGSALQSYQRSSR